jgi:hypothetical protein
VTILISGIPYPLSPSDGLFRPANGFLFVAADCLR